MSHRQYNPLGIKWGCFIAYDMPCCVTWTTLYLETSATALGHHVVCPVERKAPESLLGGSRPLPAPPMPQDLASRDLLDPSAPPHPPTPPLCSWRAQRILSWTSLGFDAWYPSSSQNRRWSSSPLGPRPILWGTLALGGSFLLTQLKSRTQTLCPHQPGPGDVLLLKQGGPCGHRYHPVRKAALGWGHSQVCHGASEYPPQHSIWIFKILVANRWIVIGHVLRWKNTDLAPASAGTWHHAWCGAGDRITLQRQLCWWKRLLSRSRGRTRWASLDSSFALASHTHPSTSSGLLPLQNAVYPEPALFFPFHCRCLGVRQTSAKGMLQQCKWDNITPRLKTLCGAPFHWVKGWDFTMTKPLRSPDPSVDTSPSATACGPTRGPLPGTPSPDTCLVHSVTLSKLLPK